jgi:virulence-associated protein VapD
MNRYAIGVNWAGITQRNRYRMEHILERHDFLHGVGGMFFGREGRTPVHAVLAVLELLRTFPELATYQLASISIYCVTDEWRIDAKTLLTEPEKVRCDHEHS